MTPTYSIRALRYARLDGPVPGPVMYFQDRLNEQVEVHAFLWLIQGNNTTAIVDTGLGRPASPGDESVEQRFGRFVVGAGEDPVTLLRSHGVEPDDVDYVLLTHLHHDHCLNTDLFPNATVVVSARGWESVHLPAHPGLVPCGLFPRHIYDYLAGPARQRLWLALPEETILPGLRVFWVGGHTPCSQAVAVNTAAGTAVMSGDVAFYYENVEAGIPVAYCTDLAQCFHALDRIRDEADILLPAHDPEVLRRHPSGVVA